MENVKGSFAIMEVSEISLSAAKVIRDTVDDIEHMALPKTCVQKLTRALTVAADAIDISTEKVRAFAPKGTYAHKRRQVEGQRIAGPKDPLRDITNFVAENAPEKVAPVREFRPPKRKSASEHLLYTPPKSGYFTPAQAAAILASAHKVLPVAVQMIENEHVPVHHSSRLYELREKLVSGKPLPDDWGVGGRPALMKPSEVDRFVQEKCAGGASIGVDDMRARLAAAAAAKATDAGLSTLTLKGISKKTESNYMALAISSSEVRGTVKSMTKTETRCTAENSVIPAFLWAVTVAAACFIPGDTTRGIAQGRLAEMVKRTNGGVDAGVVHRLLITSTDDTSTFLYNDRGKSGPEFRITTASHDSSTKAVYHRGPSSFKAGALTVKGTFTFTAGGTMFPLYFTVNGLSEAELPVDFCPSGVFVLRVPGLNPNASTDISASGVGYLVFCRAGSTEQSSFDFYRRNVYHPTIEQTRQRLGKDPHGPVPHHLKASSFIDGAGPQLQALVDSSLQELEEELKIDTYKHNPARSGAEQAADLARVFKAIKANVNQYEANKFPVSLLLRGNLVASFKSIEGNLNISAAKRNTIIDFCATLPMLMSKAATPDGIVHGFVENGMLNKRTLDFPDVGQCLGTCRVPLPKWCEDLFFSKFPVLYNAFVSAGMVTDTMMEELGFPCDRDSSGEAVHRHSGLSSESSQRTKWLSSPRQREERAALIQFAKDSNETKETLGGEKIRALLHENVKCETKLLAALKSSDRAGLCDVNFELLTKCSLSELKGFVASRTQATAKPPPGGYPKKGNAASAAAGENCLVRSAYEVRSKEILLKTPIPTEEATRTSLTEATVIEVSSGVTTAARGRVPSEYVADAVWVQKVGSSICGCKFEMSTSAEDGKRADLLLHLALARFEELVIPRIPDPKKRNHFCLAWAKANFAQVAAIAVIFRHVKRDLEGVNARGSLLKPAYFIEVGGENEHLCGAYGTEHEGAVVRFGSASRSFGERISEHATAARLLTLENRSSLFYMAYPASSAEFSKSTRRGFFEDLTFIVALAFDRSNEAGLVKLCAVDGIFHWRPWIHRIRSAKVSGCADDLQLKQLRMIAYLWEMFYGVLASPQDNVSINPGFEAFGLMLV